MSATKREHVIQVLDTPAFEGEITGDAPPADDEPSRELGRCGKAVLCIVLTLALLFVACLAVLIALEALYGGPIDYSAALTGAAAAASSKTSQTTNTIPPLFNLTVHVKDSSRLSAACVPGGTTAAVSYDGATIGAGTVPMFCAGEMDDREVVMPVWGMGAGADLTLPLALQRRDAVVDVVIRMPGAQACYNAQVLTCGVRVGRGLSPCTLGCGY